MEIQHRYAIDHEEQLIDVHNLDRASVPAGTIFKCVGCGGDQVACLGAVRQKHFKHKINTLSCSEETYLHQLAKRVFYSEYTKCLETKKPFHLVRLEKSICDHYEQQYGFTCSNKDLVYHDLTKYFNNIFLEKYHSGFVADVLLQSDKYGILFVEFAVTHKCEKEKRNSGIRILEYSLTEERDIEPIKSHLIRANDFNINLYNFKSQIVRKSICNGKCHAAIINVFIVSKNKKAILNEMEPSPDLKSQIRGNPAYVEILGLKKGEKKDQTLLFMQKVREAHFKNIPIRNCYICKYHGIDGVDNAVFCKIKKTSTPSNYAVDCSKYCPMNSLEECLALDVKNEESAKKFKYHTMIRRRYS
jgi:hypothetical protein